jgi:hypothetical protein
MARAERQSVENVIKRVEMGKQEECGLVGA